MRVLVCGSRTWDDPRIVAVVLRGLRGKERRQLTVIHGDCPTGADAIAGQWAESAIGVEVEAFPAAWATYGNLAGPIRNQLMLAEGKPVLVLAFTDDLSKSKGTADMVRRAKDAGVPVYVVGRA